MDNSQEMTTPLNRFFTFWWILAGFALFGLLALVAYSFTGGGKEDAAYVKRSGERLAIKEEVDGAQDAKLAEVKLDLAAGVAALGTTKPTPSTTAVPGSPTHDKMMAEMAAKMKAEEEAKAAAEAAAGGDEKKDVQKLTVHSTNPGKGEPLMQFAEKEITAVAGKPIELTFRNPDPVLVTGHNLIVCKPGTLDAVAKAGATLPDKDYVPDSDDVIAASKLLKPGQSDVLKFTIAEPGDYPYVCTFPGHSLLMRGVLKVTK